MSYDLEDKSRLWQIFGGLIVILFYLTSTTVGVVFPIAMHTLVCAGLVCMLGIGILLGRITITLRDIDICLCLLSPFVCIGLIQFFVIHELAGLKSLLIVVLNLGAALAVSKCFSWSLYTKALRWSILINIVLIAIVISLGTISFDSTIRTAYDSGLFMDWKNFHFPIMWGSLMDEKVRIGGVFGHANTFGVVATMGMLGLYMNKEKAGGVSQIFWWLIFIISFILTESRASLLSLLGFIVANNMLQPWSNIKRVVKNIVIMAGVAVTIIGVAFMRFNENTGDITSGRSGIMDMVSDVIMNGLPITQLIGVGLGQGSLYLSQQYGFMIPIDNSYFKLLLELGGVGTIMVVGTIGFLFWRYRNTTIFSKHTYWAFVLAIVAHSFFEADFMINTLSFGWILFMMYASQETTEDSYYENRETSRTL